MQKELSVSSPLSDVKGIGPKKAESLKRLGLNSIADLREYYPRSYEDRRNIKSIFDLKNDEKALVKGKILLVNFGRGYGRKRTLHLLVEDPTGRMEVLFFSAGFMGSMFKVGQEHFFFGKVKDEHGRITMFHPTHFPTDGDAERGILPVYPLSGGLKQKDLRSLSKLALSFDVPETLPQSIVDCARLSGRTLALTNIHYPESEEAYKAARYRLVYEELFDLKLAMLLSKDRFGRGREGISFKGNGADEYVSALPYELTGAQKRVLSEVKADMAKDTSMNRLIQGDVGSGKTAIAAAALCQAASCGFQGALMAPTEILAKQHYENLSKDFEKLGYKTVFLIGSMSASEKKAALKDIEEGIASIIIGTHALISEKVKYARLGLVITDEQHRFGVNQRQLLEAKGINPDVLIMTATPIPRTLAVVLYADLDVSVIDEMPAGRIPIITEKYNASTKKKAYKRLLEEVAAGRQAYIVAPFIEDSETLEGASAVSLYEEFSGKYPDISCALIYGSIPEADKNAVMQDFYDAKISVLISTVVIEVGVNVPNASVMIIESSERFGLAQLHQLRGRVGRGSLQSYCMLVCDPDNEVANERADTLCSTSDGFMIADKDLQIRGPGEFFGYAQHGLPQLCLADPVKHSEIVKRSASDAEQLLKKDPDLSDPENSMLYERICDKFLNLGSLTI